MKFRYSLKWMFVGVTYIALAVAACAQPADGWNSTLWFINAVALLYAILAIGFFRGRRQAIAAGFLLFAATHVAALWWSPTTMPTQYISRLIGTGIPGSRRQDAALQTQMAQALWEPSVSANASSDEYRQRVQEQVKQARARMNAYMSNKTREESISAIATMLAGLIGALAGAHVWETAKRNDET